MAVTWILISIWFSQNCIHPKVKWNYSVPAYKTYTIGGGIDSNDKCYSFIPTPESHDYILYFNAGEYSTEIPDTYLYHNVYAIYGSADSTGSFDFNIWLFIKRADFVAERLNLDVPIGILPTFSGKFVLIKTFKEKLSPKIKSKNWR